LATDLFATWQRLHADKDSVSVTSLSPTFYRLAKCDVHLGITFGLILDGTTTGFCFCFLFRFPFRFIFCFSLRSLRFSSFLPSCHVTFSPAG